MFTMGRVGEPAWVMTLARTRRCASGRSDGRHVEFLGLRRSTLAVFSRPEREMARSAQRMAKINVVIPALVILGSGVDAHDADEHMPAIEVRVVFFFCDAALQRRLETHLHNPPFFRVSLPSTTKDCRILNLYYD